MVFDETLFAHIYAVLEAEEGGDHTTFTYAHGEERSRGGKTNGQGKGGMPR